MVIAIPPLPALAVRPTRCMYSLGTNGTFSLITRSTVGISKPLEATSVANSTFTWLDLKLANDDILKRCFINECISTHGILNFRHIKLSV